ncbi:MAG: hypothetical protein V3U76_19530 [Granulosicoccus sp.]
MVLKGYFVVGVLGVTLFVLQEQFSIKWSPLEFLQSSDTYKKASGAALVFFLAFQWYFALLRSESRYQDAWRHLNRHKFVGAIGAPLLFYLHATEFGYAYLNYLTSVYFSLIVVGLFNEETLGIKRLTFLTIWTFIHITLAVLLVGMIGFHVYIAFIYE